MSRHAAGRLAIGGIATIAGVAVAQDSPNPWPRDPFRRVLPAENNADNPLQSLSLTQLTLVAVLWGDAIEPRALLQDPEGAGFIVTTGTKVGAEGGVVSAIEPGRVLVAAPAPASEPSRRMVLELFPRGLNSQSERKR